MKTPSLTFLLAAICLAGAAADMPLAKVSAEPNSRPAAAAVVTVAPQHRSPSSSAPFSLRLLGKRLLVVAIFVFLILGMAVAAWLARRSAFDVRTRSRRAYIPQRPIRNIPSGKRS